MRSDFLRWIVFSIIGSSLYSISSLALSQKEAFHQGIQFASATQGKATSALIDFKPANTINDYSDHPAEIKYSDSPENMKLKARDKLEQDSNGKSILNSIEARNEKFRYSKDPGSAAILGILEKSNSIYDVVTGQFSDCTKKSDCITTYKTETCEESPASTLQYCSRKLEIDIVPKQYETHYTLTATLSVDNHNYAGVSVNAITGKVNFLGPHDANLKFIGRLPTNIDCQSIQGKVVSESGQSTLDNVSFPSCGNGLVLEMHISNGHSKTITIDITSTKIVPEPNDRWIDSCGRLANSENCTLYEERCLEENSTHHIDGVSVSRPCWQKELVYQCGSVNTSQICSGLRAQGCEQIGSTCNHKTDGICTLYQQSFQCPIKQCKDVGMICNGETYCLDGNCVKQQKQADPDFQRSISALSVAKEAANSFSNFNSIFTGQRKACNKVFLGFIDCCADEGWGKDIHLAQCSPEEKDLAKAKDNLQTVYLGEYCRKDALGICIEHRKSYCVFPSKLARIIQMQGRYDQLKISFGDPEHSDCKGLTREQFADLDLAKMDFSDFYTEISNKKHIEDTRKLTQRLEEKMEVLEDERKSNG